MENKKHDDPLAQFKEQDVGECGTRSVEQTLRAHPQDRKLGIPHLEVLVSVLKVPD